MLSILELGGKFMTPRLRPALRGVGYGGFYLIALLVFAQLSFPYDRLRDRIVEEFNLRQTGPDALRLEIDELNGYLLSGVEAQGIRLSSAKPAAPGAESGASEKPGVMSIESARARVGLWGLLIGTTRVSFGADAFGGTISGFTSENDNSRKLKLELADLALAEAPILADAVGLPLTGTLDGELDFSLPEGKLAKADGTIQLTVSGLSVGDGKAKIRDTIALPRVDAGALTLQGQVATGQLKIEKFEGQGAHLEFAAEGGARLRDPASASVLGLTARFRFTDRYKNQNDVTRGIFGAPGSNVPGVFDLDPKNRRAKRADGFYGWRVSGALSKPTFSPNPGGNPPVKAAAATAESQ